MPLGGRIFIAAGNGEAGVGPEGRERWQREACQLGYFWYLKPFTSNVRGTRKGKKMVIR